MKGHSPLNLNWLVATGAGIEGDWDGKLQSSSLPFYPEWCWKETLKWGPPEPQTSSTLGTMALVSSLLLVKMYSQERSPSSMENSSSWGESPWSGGEGTRHSLGQPAQGRTPVPPM